MVYTGETPITVGDYEVIAFLESGEFNIPNGVFS